LAIKALNSESMASPPMLRRVADSNACGPK
jgi:hypothetical protein